MTERTIPLEEIYRDNPENNYQPWTESVDAGNVTVQIKPFSPKLSGIIPDDYRKLLGIFFISPTGTEKLYGIVHAPSQYVTKYDNASREVQTLSDINRNLKNTPKLFPNVIRGKDGFSYITGVPTVTLKKTLKILREAEDSDLSSNEKKIIALFLLEQANKTISQFHEEHYYHFHPTFKNIQISDGLHAHLLDFKNANRLITSTADPYPEEGTDEFKIRKKEDLDRKSDYEVILDFAQILFDDLFPSLRGLAKDGYDPKIISTILDESARKYNIDIRNQDERNNLILKFRYLLIKNPLQKILGRKDFSPDEIESVAAAIREVIEKAPTILIT